MATVRLFANLREAAGAGTVEIEGSTVAEVLDGAVTRFGDEFAAGVEISNVWVNGEQADRETKVAADDEIALIPPVSGGVATIMENDAVPAVLVLVLAVTLALANADSVQTLTLAAVGIAMAWIWDIRDTVWAKGAAMAAFPSLIAITATGTATYHWGTIGFALAMTVSVMVVVVWAIIDESSRSIDTLSTEITTALTGAAAVGAVIMMRLDDQTLVDAFLVVIVLGAAGAWAVERFFPDLQGVDPNLAGAVGALLGAVVVGFFVDEFSPAAALVAAAAAIAGMFAARSLLSLIRTGVVTHTTRSPGMLSAMDGAMLAAAGFWLGLLLFG